MILHSPSRPRMFDRPTFLNGTHVIPRLQVWPLDDAGTEVELSLMLPYSTERFVAHWKSVRAPAKEVPELIEAYALDPEGFVKSHFGTDITELPSLPSGPKGREKELISPQSGGGSRPSSSPVPVQSAMESLL